VPPWALAPPSIAPVRCTRAAAGSLQGFPPTRGGGGGAPAPPPPPPGGGGRGSKGFTAVLRATEGVRGAWDAVTATGTRVAVAVHGRAARRYAAAMGPKGRALSCWGGGG